MSKTLTTPFVAVGRAISAWWQRRNAYAELMALDDRMLADIGIHRSQIAAVVFGNESRAGSQPAAAPQAIPAVMRNPLHLRKAA